MMQPQAVTNREPGQSRSLDIIGLCVIFKHMFWFEITAEVLDPSIIQRNRLSAGSSC